jgi:Styrene monooxygenase A putative substrate binding domain
VFPALTTSGPCEIMVFEGIPGGPMDCWSEVRSADHHLDVSLDILRRLIPWEDERARSVSLTDSNGILVGRFSPTVRKPLARLPSGAVVLGMADVVCLNDPITGQGANNASKCASLYLNRILERGGASFDAEWMQNTFDVYWEYARYVTARTNMMLRPPAAHVLQLLGAAASKPQIARWFVNGFDNPKDLFPYVAQHAKLVLAHRHCGQFIVPRSIVTPTVVVEHRTWMEGLGRRTLSSAAMRVSRPSGRSSYCRVCISAARVPW